jgi:hypothetical protein
MITQSQVIKSLENLNFSNNEIIEARMKDGIEENGEGKVSPEVGKSGDRATFQEIGDKLRERGINPEITYSELKSQGFDERQATTISHALDFSKEKEGYEDGK